MRRCCVITKDSRLTPTPAAISGSMYRATEYSEWKTASSTGLSDWRASSARAFSKRMSTPASASRLMA